MILKKGDDGFGSSVDVLEEDGELDAGERVLLSANNDEVGFGSSIDALDEGGGGLDAGEGVFEDPTNRQNESMDPIADDENSHNGIVNPPIESNYKQGEKVEGFFRGQKWYSCTIKSFNDQNGTYDLIYDDGDEERGVSETNIRKRDQL